MPIDSDLRYIDCIVSPATLAGARQEKGFSYPWLAFVKSCSRLLFTRVSTKEHWPTGRLICIFISSFKVEVLKRMQAFHKMYNEGSAIQQSINQSSSSIAVIKKEMRMVCSPLLFNNGPLWICIVSSCGLWLLLHRSYLNRTHCPLPLRLTQSSFVWKFQPQIVVLLRVVMLRECVKHEGSVFSSYQPAFVLASHQSDHSYVSRRRWFQVTRRTARPKLNGIYTNSHFNACTEHISTLHLMDGWMDWMGAVKGY